MLWRQLRQRSYWRAGGLIVVIAILAGWIGLPPSVFQSFGAYLRQLGLSSYAPKLWEDVNYDRVIATFGVIIPFIQLLQDWRKKESRAEDDRDDQQNRRDMLELLRARLSGLLEKTINLGGEMGLGFKEVPDALIRLEALSRIPKHAAIAVPAGTPILEIFEKYERHLLILGAPGAGKTTLLRKLARDLVEQAVNDGQRRIPIIFELSNWAADRKPLDEWLVDELRRSYSVPQMVAQGWVSSKQILPLFDGLDEVPQTHRDTCVEAINGFRRDNGLVPVAVCCRIKDFCTVAEKIDLVGAVAVQPLARADVSAYLNSLGEPLTGVRQVLAQDTTLWELLDTPLMVDILIRAYHGATAPSLIVAGGLEERRRHLFKAYVDRMFLHRGDAKRYPRAKTEHWLTWLSQQLFTHNEKDFFLENLQIDWLPTRSQWWHWLLVGLLIFGLFGGLVGGLVGGLFVIIDAGIVPGKIAQKSWPNQAIWASVRNYLMRATIFGLVGGLVFGGNAFIRHFVLRAQLAFARCAPFRYVPFLEYATTLLFLERNGGAYRFRHDLLQRYFADLTPSAKAAKP